MKGSTEFVSYHFDRFIDYALGRISPDYLHLLTEQDRKHIAHKEKFIKEGSLEEKLLLLSKVGYPFVITVGSRRSRLKFSQLERLLQLFHKLISFQRKPASYILKDHHFFFLADSDIVKSLMLAANLHNSPANDYKVVSDRMQVYKKAEQDLARNVGAAQDLDTLVIRAIRLGSAVMHQQEFEALHKISYKKYIVLAHLSKVREATAAQIKKQIGLIHIKDELKEMTEAGLIQSKFFAGYQDQGRMYWITGHGEMVLIKARKYFLP